MNTAETPLDLHPIGLAPLSDAQRRAFDHLVTNRDQGDGDKRLAAARDLDARSFFVPGTSDGTLRRIVDAYLANNEAYCSTGQDRFRTVVFGSITPPDHPFDQFRMVLADPGWLCNGSERSDYSDCHGTLLEYQVHSVAEDLWVPTYRAACQLGSHRTRVTETIRIDHGVHLQFVDEDSDAHKAAPILWSKPEPTPEPEAPRPAPWFPDQRWTYTLDQLAARDVPTEQQFVTAEAMVDAIREYQAKYDLCNAGVGEFLEEFGLSLTKRYEVIVDFKDHEGHRHEILRFEVTSKTDPGDWLSDGDIDSPMNDAFEEHIRECAFDGDSDAEINFCKGVDTYYRINEID